MTRTTGRIPLWLKLVYSAFVAVLVTVCWYFYGPTSFLYFCDVALLITLVGIRTESALLISMYLWPVFMIVELPLMLFMPVHFLLARLAPRPVG